MNDEGEGAMEVAQEPNRPPEAPEERPPTATGEVDGAEQCETLAEAVGMDGDAGVEHEKVEGLISEGMDGVARDCGLNRGDLLQVEDGVGEKQEVAVEEDVKVEEMDEKEETFIRDGEGQVDVAIGERGDSAEVEKEGKDRMEKKMEDGLEAVDKIVGGDTGVGEEGDGRIKGDGGLSPGDVQGGEVMEDGKTEVLEAEIEVVKESESEVREETEVMEDEKMEVLDTEVEVVKEGESEVREETGVMGEEGDMVEEEEGKGIKVVKGGRDDEGNGMGVEDKETEREEGDDDKEMQGEEDMVEVGEGKGIQGVKEGKDDGDNGMEVEDKEAEREEGDDDKEMQGEEDKETGEDEDKETASEAEKELDLEEGRGVEAEEGKEVQEDETEEAAKAGGGKRKRGRNSKAVAKAPPRKIVGEDVCFICLDGGDLVLCDRRGCPKAYHPSCVDRDEAFFRSKGRWNCGWHLCRQCKKNAHYMCYTCQFSLCKGCFKDDAAFVCVRGNKGLCETCMKSVMLIENNEGTNGTGQSAPDDKSIVDLFFKDYWNEQKEKLALTSEEIEQAKNRRNRHNADNKPGVSAEILAGSTEGGAISDGSLGNVEATNSKRKKSKKRARPSTKEVGYDTDGSADVPETSGAKKRGKRRLKSQSKGAGFELDTANHTASSQRSTEWASRELLEFVMHMKNGDTSALSQFDVQELLLDYIKSNKLRDPRRRSQIICDAMLQKLFGKERVGHFEMLKLIESHFLLKDDSQADDNQGSVVDAEGNQLDADENTDSLADVGKYKGKKARKKGDRRGLQSNLDDYAAIDTHNINLIYLRRNLIEGLMEDSERLHEKVVGSFVRIRIPGAGQKQDIYRLVQVVGTTKAAQPYKVGKRTADCMLEILNLSKTEVVSIDTISNQDFTEDECKRLRQSIKCGLISRLTVGDILDKAKDLQEVRVADWFETEITRLNHLRDRASDLGRKKQLRECVEKLQLLSTPEERQRRLDEIPEVHADPNMDPSHESEDESEPEDKMILENNTRTRESYPRRDREHYSSSHRGDSGSADQWSSPSKPNRKWESSRSPSGKGFSGRHVDTSLAEEAFVGRSWSPVGDKVSPKPPSSEKSRTPDSATGRSSQFSEPRTNETTPATPTTPRPVVKNDVKISDTEKIWHYKDPSGKVQGPFSVNQLRKWNNSGYFPATLRIWKTAEGEDDSILLTEALAGRFQKEQSQPDTASKRPTTPSADFPKYPSGHPQNPPSTSSQGTGPGSSGRARASRWSGSPAPVQVPGSATGPNGMLPSPTPDNGQPRPASAAFGAAYSQNLPSQPTAPGGSAMAHAPQPPTEPATTNNGQTQNPAASGQPWGSGGGYMPRPEMMNPNPTQNLTNPNPMPGQTPQTGYAHWVNTQVNAQPNNLPPPPVYGAGLSANTTAMPSQAPWTPNMQWVGMAAPESQPGGSNLAWVAVQANPQMGWLAPTGPAGPVGQYGSQPGALPGVMQAPGAAPGSQPANNAMSQVAGGMNPGWAGPPANPGQWNWQPPRGGGGSGMASSGGARPKRNVPCPYLNKGFCRKGARCDYIHNK